MDQEKFRQKIRKKIREQEENRRRRKSGGRSGEIGRDREIKGKVWWERESRRKFLFLLSKFFLFSANEIPCFPQRDFFLCLPREHLEDAGRAGRDPATLWVKSRSCRDLVGGIGEKE